MKRKSLTVVFIVVLLLAAVVGPVGADPPTKVGIAYDLAGLGDNGFNDLAQAGAVRAEADFGLKVFEKELVKPNGTELDPYSVLTKLAKKSELVVAVAFQYGEAAEQAALADPDTDFVIIDFAYVAPPPNLLGTMMATNEGSFLVGAAAALESDTGHFGFIGGVAFPVIFEFEAGFTAGVTHIDDTATVEVAYADTFVDQAIVYDIAMNMYTAGADVIMHAAGFAGYGLLAAARDYSMATGTHVWAIGVDFDQYQLAADDIKPHILTSMLKNIDVVTYDVIESFVEGTFTGGFDRWDLSRNGVDYATSGGFIDGYIPTLEALRADIIDGTIVVPLMP